MRLYRTNQFHSNHSNTTRSGLLYYVFSDSERNHIKDTNIALMMIMKEESPIAKWNKNDHEALYQIVTWPLHISNGGKHADLTEDQCNKIDKMLRKLLNDPSATFFSVFKLELDTLTEMTDRDMRREMDSRREYAKISSASTLPLLFDFTQFK